VTKNFFLVLECVIEYVSI